MAINEAYAGLEIIHLEDFSSEITLEASNPARNFAGVQNSIVHEINKSNYSQKALFGEICKLVYSSTGCATNTSASWAEVATNPKVRCLNNELVVSATIDKPNSSANVYLTTLNTKSVPSIGLLFTIPDGYSDKRVILSFDYLPVDGNILPLRNHGTVTMVRPSVSAEINDPKATYVFPNNFNGGRAEFVFESGRLKIYFRGEMVSDTVYTDKTMLFGDVWTQVPFTNTGINMTNVPDEFTPFSIANLAMVSVPLESSLDRLGALRVEKTLVSHLDGVPHSPEDALNGTVPDDGLFVEVGSIEKTIKFNALSLKPGEHILGNEVCLASSDPLVTGVLNCDIYDDVLPVLQKEFQLLGNRSPRKQVGSLVLGDAPEDYENVSIKIKSLEG